MSFTAAQVEQLLRPINETRVLKDGKGHSHVSQQDILAHLTRVFGFGGFDIDVLHAECIFEEPRNATEGKPANRYDACYRAMVRLTIRDADGNAVCHYENGSTATAQNQTRGDAHDLAYKSAISLSVKRAAIALGDGFGLSLYNKGQLSALVKATLVKPEGAASEDVQAGVPQQVSMGNDEVDVEPVAPQTPPTVPLAAQQASPAPSPADRARGDLKAVCGNDKAKLNAAVERFGKGSDGKPLKDTTDAKAIDALVAEYKAAAA